MTTDTELRGLVLQRFYERRNENSLGFISLTMSDFPDAYTRNELLRILDQLAEQGLLKMWDCNRDGSGPDLGHGAISAVGVDVIEGNRPPPMPMSFSTTNVTNNIRATNVQIGEGNIQLGDITVQELLLAIEKAHASPEEKSTALSLLKNVLAHPLVTAILGGLAGSGRLG